MQVLKCTRKLLDPNQVMKEAKEIALVLSQTDPLKLYLFGSAAEGKMTDQSDFDFLLVFETAAQIKLAQKKLKKHYPLSQYPVDIIWVTQEEYQRKKELGGICFVVEREGLIMGGTESTKNDQI